MYDRTFLQLISSRTVGTGDDSNSRVGTVQVLTKHVLASTSVQVQRFHPNTPRGQIRRGNKKICGALPRVRGAHAAPASCLTILLATGAISNFVMPDDRDLSTDSPGTIFEQSLKRRDPGD
jgi:hypothetical protein